MPTILVLISQRIKRKSKKMVSSIGYLLFLLFFKIVRISEGWEFQSYFKIIVYKAFFSILGLKEEKWALADFTHKLNSINII